MQEQFSRSLPLLGEAGLSRLSQSHVAVVGLGGVGGHTVEALARAGVAALSLFDGDEVKITNLNRQLFATQKTVGMRKVDAAALRIREVASECKLTLHDVTLTPENIAAYDLTAFDYIVDAIDDIPAKVALIEAAHKAGTPIISSMGTGNKLDPTRFRIADIEKTAVCPLARHIRRELRARGIRGVRVLYSEEPPRAGASEDGRRVPASLSYVPPVAGLLLAGEVIQQLAGIK